MSETEFFLKNSVSSAFRRRCRQIFARGETAQNHLDSNLSLMLYKEILVKEFTPSLLRADRGFISVRRLYEKVRNHNYY